MFLLNNFIINEVGVTTVKKIKPITNGETIFPKNKPNLNHALLNGERILELIKPKMAKIKLTSNDQALILLLSNNGNSPMIKNTIEKTIPKLLLEPILIFVFSIL